MKAWGIEVNEGDANKIMEAIEEDKKLVGYEHAKMKVYAKVMLDMLEHLEIEVEYGFITESERRKIMEGMKLIAEVYKGQNKDEINDRINKFTSSFRVVCKNGSKRIQTAHLMAEHLSEFAGFC